MGLNFPAKHGARATLGLLLSSCLVIDAAAQALRAPIMGQGYLGAGGVTAVPRLVLPGPSALAAPSSLPAASLPSLQPVLSPNAAAAPVLALPAARAVPAAALAASVPTAANAVAGHEPAGVPGSSIRAASLSLGSIASAIARSIRSIRSGGGSLESQSRSAGDIGARLIGEELTGRGAAAPVAFQAGAPDRTPGGALLPEEENSVRVFDKASPSVVYIKNLQSGGGRRSFFQREADDEEKVRGQGSGYVWDRDGHIVTNFHVVQGGDAFKVVFKDGSELDARLVGTDPTKDIAVLKVSPVKPLTPIELGDSGSLRVGQKAIAIGNPFGLAQTMTQGVVSAVDREMEGVGGVLIRGMVQTDAPINPGNSGGPLLDSGARLIGMNTLSLGAGGGSNVGIGFAVPVDSIKKAVPELIKFGNVDRPTLGVSLATQEELARHGYRIEGVFVKGVQPGGPAAAGGLERGDIITSIDGAKVESFDDLYAALEKRKSGDTVKVGVQRGDREGTLSVRLSSLRQSAGRGTTVAHRP
ncbi:MAG: trypsin-like peptidase domain-containing protein [Elusimicrobia bacterium]|nr:trypsin-like peptidase domain-containing protein [Elusimicrobiota bacterium]